MFESKHAAPASQRMFVSILALVAAVIIAPSGGVAADDNVEDLIDALSCKSGQECEDEAPYPRKRGFNDSDEKDRPARRSFEFEPEAEVAQVSIEEKASVGALPSADREIYFEFNSAEIRPEARPQLDIVGKALTDERLARNFFLIIGHTDAKGSDTYNLNLSERRAKSARQYLIEVFGIEPSRLKAYGRGEKDLKNPSEPFASKNRRVQIVNRATSAD